MYVIIKYPFYYSDQISPADHFFYILIIIDVCILRLQYVYSIISMY